MSSKEEQWNRKITENLKRINFPHFLQHILLILASFGLSVMMVVAFFVN